MDRERVLIQAKIYGTKTKVKLNFILDVVAVGLVILGAYNLIIATGLGAPTVLSDYRNLAPMLGFWSGSGILHMMDVAIMVLGAVFVWFR